MLASMASDAEFEAEAARLTALLASSRFEAVERLRVVEEAWARHILGMPVEVRDGRLVLDGELVPKVRELVEAGLEPAIARRAEPHLERAERCQWEIGTWATGSGEGLASMFEVRCLELARAWLLVACGPAFADAARTIAKRAIDDPNHIAESQRPHADALFRFLLRST
jgi:hypothetical protein